MKSISIGVKSPLECTIIHRLNRFVVEIQVDGILQQACINNTGRLKGYLCNGNTGFCIRNTHRLKTAYRLFAIREGNLGAIIDTQLQMKVLEEALGTGLIPWLDGCVILKRNARLGNSVMDYLLACHEKQVYLEVKSAVLREGRYAMYPDCPSARGRRHVRQLIDHRVAGGSVAILFIAALPNVEAFKPSQAGDPELFDLLIEAQNTGVDIKAVALYYNPRDSSAYVYHTDLPVEL
jgi:sugar fermentation stimulation protein A